MSGLSARYVRVSLGRGVSFMTSSGMPTKARLTVRVVTVGVLFEDGNGGDRKGDVAPRKEMDSRRISQFFWLLYMVDEYFSHLPSYV